MWKLSRQHYRRFPRNALIGVVVAVDFEPILKIGKGQQVSDFQEFIRERFPEFTEGQTLELNFSGPGQVETRQDKAFEFAASSELKIVLGNRRLSRSANVHKSRDEVRDDMRLALNALEAVYSPIVVTRVGLRYVNLIDPEQISKDLGKDVGWESLIRPQFINLPEDFVDLEKTRFVYELNSGMEHGVMVLRYGITYRKDRKRECMHFDMDRFVADRVPIADIPHLIEQFSDDLFDLFISAAGQDLIDWLGTEEARSA